jgi:hypothetical protein
MGLGAGFFEEAAHPGAAAAAASKRTNVFA